MPDVQTTSTRVFAWGDDGCGQCLGGARSSLESIVAQPTEVRLPDGRGDFGQLCAGWEQTLLVTGRGSLWAGGSNKGQCISEEEDVGRALGPRALDLAGAEDAPVVAADAGREHFVGIRRGGELLLTWSSSNEFGQAGQGPARVGVGPCGPSSFLVQPGGARVCAVSCGQDHAVALTERGEVFCWGDGSRGQLGLSAAAFADGSSAQQHAPRHVDAGGLRGLPVRQVAAGAQHTMALGLSGQVLSWGDNRHGRLGLGPEFEESEQVRLPTLVGGLDGEVRRIAAGGQHSAVVLRRGVPLLAGDNRRGQLGLPAAEVKCSTSFRRMRLGDCSFAVRTVSCGLDYTLLLSFEGELFGVGANDRHQLGLPSADYVDSPQRVPLPDELIVWAVAAGPGHAAVLASEPPESMSRLPSASQGAVTLRCASAPHAGVDAGGRAAEHGADSGDGSPLPRTKAHRGTRGLLEEDPPLAQHDGADHALGEELWRRLRSTGCISSAGRGPSLRVPLSRQAPSAAPSTDGVVLLRQVVQVGVAPGVQFACLSVDGLRELVHAVPAGAAAEAVAATGLLRATVETALRCPTMLGCCFLFPATSEAKLDAGGLWSQVAHVRTLGPEAQEGWPEACLHGLRALAPKDGLLKNMRTRDQVRALVVYLLVVDWRSLLGGPAAAGASRAGALEAATELLRMVARLPVAGRAAFRDVVADECGELSVMRDALLPAAHAITAAAMRRCKDSQRLLQPLWESVLLLQLLWASELRRAGSVAVAARAAHATEAAEDGQVTRSVSKIGRSLSKVAVEAESAAPVGGAALLAGAPLPRESFQIQALLEFEFPPQVELGLFVDGAKMQVIDPERLCTDKQWEIKDGQLPPEFRSFMANGNLVPTSYKQEVLKTENIAKQQDEVRRNVMGEMAFGAVVWPGGVVPAATVFFVLEVRRSHLLHDTIRQLQSADPRHLRKPLKVVFANEEGVDEGGVTKEYFRLLSEQLFAPDFGMFQVDPDSRYLWFEPASLNEPDEFTMVGEVLGLAVYNNLPGFNVNFPAALFKKLKSDPLTMEDFQQVFPAHAASLNSVMSWAPPPGLSDDEADQLFQDTFCIDFSVSFQALGETRTVNLLGAGGDPPAVTLGRRAEFAELFKEWYLCEGIKTQFQAFQLGFGRVCGSSPVFDCLSAAELQAIACGEAVMDFAALRRGSAVVDTAVPFRDGYLDELWEILESLGPPQKRQFLRFVTGSDLAPLGGLERIGLKIQRNGGDIADLPTSHTCFNLLTLPEYGCKEKLRSKLVAAIEYAEGFGIA